MGPPRCSTCPAYEAPPKRASIDHLCCSQQHIAANCDHSCVTRATCTACGAGGAAGRVAAPCTLRSLRACRSPRLARVDIGGARTQRPFGTRLCSRLTVPCYSCRRVRASRGHERPTLPHPRGYAAADAVVPRARRGELGRRGCTAPRSVARTGGCSQQVRPCATGRKACASVKRQKGHGLAPSAAKAALTPAVGSARVAAPAVVQVAWRRWRRIASRDRAACARSWMRTRHQLRIPGSGSASSARAVA